MRQIQFSSFFGQRRSKSHHLTASRWAQNTFLFIFIRFLQVLLYGIIRIFLSAWLFMRCGTVYVDIRTQILFAKNVLKAFSKFLSSKTYMLLVHTLRTMGQQRVLHNTIQVAKWKIFWYREEYITHKNLNSNENLSSSQP